MTPAKRRDAADLEIAELIRKAAVELLALEKKAAERGLFVDLSLHNSYRGGRPARVVHLAVRRIFKDRVRKVLGEEIVCIREQTR